MSGYVTFKFQKYYLTLRNPCQSDFYEYVSSQIFIHFTYFPQNFSSISKFQAA